MPLKQLSRKQVIIILAVVVVIIIGLFLFFIGKRQTGNTGPAVTLTVWGTEDENTGGGIITSDPAAKITYVHFDPANYESRLLNALAAGNGPDVFEIGDHALPRWASVLAPLPPAFSQSFNILKLTNAFPDVVSDDFVLGTSTIYGLPLSIDTLAMFYNKDLFNSAGIAVPPSTWNDFQTDLQKLRAVNAQGQLTRAGATLGGSMASIPHAPDLISLLMLQNGATMTLPSGAPDFAGDTTSPGNAAFNFYLQFANPSSQYYAWNDSFGDALSSFASGKVAVFFGYQNDLAAIRAKAPFLNMGIAPMPQAQGAAVAVNYPQYSGFVVARAGKVMDAWNFILWLAATPSTAQSYQAATGKPPALRTLIQGEQNDPDLSVFAAQALTAKSWYQADDAKINMAFDEAVKKVLSGAETSQQALEEAQIAISQISTQ